MKLCVFFIKLIKEVNFFYFYKFNLFNLFSLFNLFNFINFLVKNNFKMNLFLDILVYKHLLFKLLNKFKNKFKKKMFVKLVLIFFFLNFKKNNFKKNNYNYFYKKKFYKKNYNYFYKKLIKFYKITLKLKFKVIFLKNLFFIKFTPSSINKYINIFESANFNFFFIRKNKIFNKSRYSRNRQLYRTGVYWCLWLNILIVYGLFFIFYRLTFNFGYFWYGIFILLYTVIIPKILKFKYYSFFNVYYEFLNFFKWIGLLIYNFNNDIFNLFMIFYNFNKFNNKIYFLLNFIEYFFKKFDNFIYFFIWEPFKGEDDSFFKHKIIKHYCIQFYNIFIKFN